MKMLVVEDTEDSRIMLVDLLKVQGYEVDSAVNGLDALEKIAISSPDLIVSDILMPEMDGFELCRKIKSDPQLRLIPFIFYTASLFISPSTFVSLSRFKLFDSSFLACVSFLR